MKKIFALFLFVVSFLTIQAQTPYDTVNVRDPQNFVEMTTVDTAYFQLIGRKANLNRRMSLTTLKNWILSGVSGIDSVYYIGDQLNILQGSTLWQATTGRVADSLVLSNDSLFLYENGTSIFVDLTGISADSTVFATLYALADTAAAIRGDIPVPDGNGIFDAANDGDTTAVSSVVLGQDFAVDMDGNDWLFDGLVEDDTTSRIMTLRGDGSLAFRWLDSILNNYTTGSGTTGTLPIWTGANALGNSSVTESGGNVVGTSFTGAFGLATGTTAQAPVGANGRIRYNTTENGISAWNGDAAAWQYLPWADADNWSAGYLPYTNSTGSALTASSDIRYVSNEFFLRQSSDQGAYTFQMQGYMHIVPYSGASSRIIGGAGNSSTATITARANDNSGIAMQIETGSLVMSGTNPRYWQSQYSSSNVFGMNVDNDGTGLACSFDETLIEKSALDSINRSALYLGAFDANNGSISGRVNLLSMVEGTYGADNQVSNHFKSAGLFQSWRHKRGSLLSSVQNVAYWGTYTAVSDSATYSVKLVPETMVSGTIQKSAAFYGNKVYVGNSTTPAYTLDINTGGVRIASQSAAPTIAANVLYADSDDSDLVFSPDGTNWRYIPLSVTQTLENHGTISTSTDGSGDIVVAHGMGTTPTSVQVTVTGTTPYVVTVHTIGSTNFTVRFYDMTGAAVASTAVTATWHAKT